MAVVKATVCTTLLYALLFFGYTCIFNFSWFLFCLGLTVFKAFRMVHCYVLHSLCVITIAAINVHCRKLFGNRSCAYEK